MGRAFRIIAILASSAFLASSVGCQLLGIPSYRNNVTGGECTADCPPGVLPPAPSWIAKWCKKDDLPQPPEHPRFHPLPTRPMFSQDPRRPEGLGRLPNTMVQGNPSNNYGSIPTPQNGQTQQPFGPGLSDPDGFTAPGYGPQSDGSGSRF